MKINSAIVTVTAAVAMTVVSATAFAGLLGKTGSTFSDPSKVDRLNMVNTATWAYAVTPAYANVNNGGNAYGISGVNDMGQQNCQVDYSGQSDTNAGAIRLTLPTAVTLDKIVLAYLGGNYNPKQDRLLVSSTGFGSMTEAAAWADPNVAGGTKTFAAQSVRYIQYEYLGTRDYYFGLSEIKAYSPAAVTTGMFDGYNIFNESAVAGPIPAGALYRGGTWADDPNNILNLDEQNYLRGAGSSGTNWFVIPLNDEFELRGASTGFYGGQSWGGGITLSLTDDTTISGGTVWNTVYTQGGALVSGTIMPFNAATRARFVRIETPAAGSDGAMCEFQLYAAPIPEPTALSILGLAAAAAALRRSQRAPGHGMR